MTESIFSSVKKNLGIGEGDTAFDDTVLTHVNTSFSTLHQMGVGPEDGFMIADDTPTWGDFIGDDKLLNMVKTYVCLSTRMLFDPPTTGYLISAFEKQIQQLEWRINVVRETTDWRDPNPVDLPEDSFGDPAVVDGGSA